MVAGEVFGSGITFHRFAHTDAERDRPEDQQELCFPSDGGMLGRATAVVLRARALVSA